MAADKAADGVLCSVVKTQACEYLKGNFSTYRGVTVEMVNTLFLVKNLYGGLADIVE